MLYTCAVEPLPQQDPSPDLRDSLTAAFFAARVQARASLERYALALQGEDLAELGRAADAAALDAGRLVVLSHHIRSR